MKIFHYDWSHPDSTTAPDPHLEIILKGSWIYAYKAARDGRYRWTASVSDGHSLEQAYCATQNDIECRDGVSPSWRGVGRHRSTSVGDIIVRGEDVYVVQGCGFKQLGETGARIFRRKLGETKFH